MSVSLQTIAENIAELASDQGCEPIDIVGQLFELAATPELNAAVDEVIDQMETHVALTTETKH